VRQKRRRRDGRHPVERPCSVDTIRTGGLRFVLPVELEERVVIPQEFDEGLSDEVDVD
jgi:hypothetical protein